MSPTQSPHVQQPSSKLRPLYGGQIRLRVGVCYGFAKSTWSIEEQIPDEAAALHSPATFQNRIYKGTLISIRMREHEVVTLYLI